MASILGDPKELFQKRNDCQNELESSTSTASLPPPPTRFHVLTPKRIAKPYCSATKCQFEVRMREGRAVNIHMFCSRRPGLLPSAARSIENLGLDVQQAVISCSNGFSLDVFKAELCKEGQGLFPEDIKAVLLLLQSVGFRGVV
ncbi:hypothetical protein EJB05_27042, partial [Eragrostis curvula]